MRAIRPRITLDAVHTAAILALFLALLVAGCGDFWQSPNGTSTTSTPSSSSGGTASTTTLSASSSSIAAGSSLALTADVTPTAATGTVTFYSNGANIGTATLSAGLATYTATFASAGTDTLTAKYSGDSTYAGSTSSAVSLTVTAASSIPAAPTAAATLFSPSGPPSQTNLVLSPAASWSVATDSHLNNVANLVVSGNAVEDIEGDGYCVYYSGKTYFAAGQANSNGIYTLAGGGYLAPTSTTGLDCE